MLAFANCPKAKIQTGEAKISVSVNPFYYVVLKNVVWLSRSQVQQHNELQTSSFCSSRPAQHWWVVREHTSSQNSFYSSDLSGSLRSFHFISVGLRSGPCLWSCKGLGGLLFCNASLSRLLNFHQWTKTLPDLIFQELSFSLHHVTG